MIYRATFKVHKKEENIMRKIIVGLSLAIALVAGGTYMSACKSTTPVGGDSTAVVDSIKKDTVNADSAKNDTVKKDTAKSK